MRLKTWCLLVLCTGVFIQPCLAQQPDGNGAVSEALQVTVVNGYLVAHLAGEDVTIVAKPKEAETVPNQVDDSGWATWAQRGQLLWRGEMEDSQGRLYNIRILPGYVAPWHHAEEGWSDAGSDLSEYGRARNWNRLGRHSRAAFKWGWKDAFWEFGLKGSGQAWSENMVLARRRTERKTFGWPLAYPWAVIASTFETLLRVPLGTAGAALGTATGAVIVPVTYTTWPTVKAAWHAGFDGTLLPVAGWTWQTMAAPPASLFASAPNPSRADGTWMKVIKPSGQEKKPEPEATRQPLSDASVAFLADYAHEAHQLDALEEDARRRDSEELAAIRARQESVRETARTRRAEHLRIWADAHRAALAELVREGGDYGTIRTAEDRIIVHLKTLGLTESDAHEALRILKSHPLTEKPFTPAIRSGQPANRDDKTDPLKGALDTAGHVSRQMP